MRSLSLIRFWITNAILTVKNKITRLRAPYRRDRSLVGDHGPRAQTLAARSFKRPLGAAGSGLVVIQRPAEDGRTLFQKRAGSLPGVGTGQTEGKGVILQGQTGFEIHVQTRGDGLFGRP